MPRCFRLALAIPLGDALWLLFIVIPETGRMVAARLLGGPSSPFYLVRITGVRTCLGCNITGVEKLSPAGGF